MLDLGVLGLGLQILFFFLHRPYHLIKVMLVSAEEQQEQDGQETDALKTNSNSGYHPPLL